MKGEKKQEQDPENVIMSRSKQGRTIFVARDSGTVLGKASGKIVFKS